MRNDYISLHISGKLQYIVCRCDIRSFYLVLYISSLKEILIYNKFLNKKLNWYRFVIAFIIIFYHGIKIFLSKAIVTPLFISWTNPYRYNLSPFSRRLLVTTDTELSAIAAPAIMGFKRKPLKG